MHHFNVSFYLSFSSVSFLCNIFVSFLYINVFMYHICIFVKFTGVILQTEGGIWKTEKRALFHYKKVQKGTPNLNPPHVHSLFTIVLIKQVFEKISHQGQHPEVRLSFSLK